MPSCQQREREREGKQEEEEKEERDDGKGEKLLIPEFDAAVWTTVGLTVALPGRRDHHHSDLLPEIVHCAKERVLQCQAGRNVVR